MEPSKSSAAMEIIDSGCSTPYMTAPSSPPRLNSAALFSQLNHNPSLRDANFTLPSPSRTSNSSPKHFTDDPIDFAFHFINKFNDSPRSAEDLFHHGKIKPLIKSVLETESEAEQNDVVFKTANSSPRRKRKDIDLAPSSDDEVRSIGRSAKREFNQFNQLNETLSSNNNKTFWTSFEDENGKQRNVKTAPKRQVTTSFWNSFSLTKAYRKWKLKDLLFRSASEGRATDKVVVDPSLMNYSILTKSKSREATSFRSLSDGSSCSMKRSGSGTGRKPGGGVPVSAHELHYTVNRAVSEEMKRKTFLPYRQSWLGCLGFNPGGHHFPGRAGTMTRV